MKFAKLYKIIKIPGILFFGEMGGNGKFVEGVQ